MYICGCKFVRVSLLVRFGSIFREWTHTLHFVKRNWFDMLTVALTYFHETSGRRSAVWSAH